MPATSLDDRIEQLSVIETFPPPPGFAEHAQARDPADWQVPFGTVPDDSNPPLRDIAEGREPGDVTTLRDASVLGALQKQVSAREKGNTP